MTRHWRFFSKPAAGQVQLPVSGHWLGPVQFFALRGGCAAGAATGLGWMYFSTRPEPAFEFWFSKADALAPSRFVRIRPSVDSGFHSSECRGRNALRLAVRIVGYAEVRTQGDESWLAVYYGLPSQSKDQR